VAYLYRHLLQHRFAVDAQDPYGTVLRANDLSLGVSVSDGMQVDLDD
jgi:hypothetical protein